MVERTAISLRQRRDELRATLVRAVVVRRRRRKGARVALLVAIAAAALWPPAPRARELPAPIAPADPFAVVVVHDSDDIVARLRIVAEPRVRLLDDAGLLAELRSCGRAAGIARVGSQLLVPGLVLDPLP